MKRYYKNIIVIIITIVIVLLITGGIYAYLTDTDQATNVFTQGSVKISLTESNWDPTNAQDIRPGNIINKNPKITNIGKNSAYVYLKVEIPIVQMTDGDLNLLFNINVNNTDWTYLNDYPCPGKSTDTVVFYYNTELPKNSSTTTLFDNVIVNNFSQNVSINKDIVVTGYAIQTRNLSSGTTIESAYTTYFLENDRPECNSKTIYRWSDTQWNSEQYISNLIEGADYVTNKSQLVNMSTNTTKYYLKHEVEFDTVTTSSLCFEITNEMVTSHPEMTAGEYCLKGSDSTEYETNKSTLTTAFGSANCTETSSKYSCQLSELIIDAWTSGTILARTDDCYCQITFKGNTICMNEHYSE